MLNGTQYSANIAIYLQANGTRLEVAGCLENTCTLRDFIELEPCNAELVIIVDGKERRKPVFLDKGITNNSKIVEFSDLSYK